MKFLVTADTDTGISKHTNQDSVCVKVADTPAGQAVLAIICDGMGGLSKGELASATVIRTFSDWFEQELPAWLEPVDWQQLSDRWDRIIKECNLKIQEYGKKNDTTLGTTFSGLLIIGTKYMIVHVGDSRVYKINSAITQLTQDQTVVGREIQRGNMTPAQAEKDPRRNVLLQCVGASRTVMPEITFGEVESGTLYLLCSDGFRHEISADEIRDNLNPGKASGKKEMHRNSLRLIETVKSRMEKDNISVILVKADQ